MSKSTKDKDPAVTAGRTEPETRPATRWMQAQKTSPAAFRGALVRAGWKADHQCSQAEYEKVIRTFLNSPPRKRR